MSVPDPSISRTIGVVNDMCHAAAGPAEVASRPGDARGAVADVRHVLHLVDTLEIGGQERVAVNLVNVLPRDRYRMSLCTTRRDGPLADLVAPDVSRARLERTSRFDPSALVNIVTFIRRHRVQLLHAHGSALFLAQLAARFAPYPAVVWHDHFGRYVEEARPVWLYRLATAGIAGVITVNSPLADWARRSLRVRADRVWYVPNFATSEADAASIGEPLLPGTQDARIICVANFRPQKDHMTLIAALDQVVKSCPAAHLLLVGEMVDPDYGRMIRREIATRRLESHVTILGVRRDVPALLQACAVGVLSSVSEGLPLALIEYGANGLASIATDVGECAAVLDDGRAGLVVKPGDPAALGTALLALLTSRDRRLTLGSRLQQHVQTTYGQAEGVRRICDIYDQVLDGR